MPVVFSPKILPFHIKKAPVKAIKIPNINKVLFMVIIFLLTNYLDLYSIIPKNRLLVPLRREMATLCLPANKQGFWE